MNLQENIISRFKENGIDLDGIATFRRIKDSQERVIAVDNNGEWRIVSLNDHNQGYIRQLASSTYNEQEVLDCGQSIMRQTIPLTIVLTLPRDKNILSVAQWVKSILVNIEGVDKMIIVSETSDRQIILDEEYLPENDLSIHKIVFNLEVLYLSNNCVPVTCNNNYVRC